MSKAGLWTLLEMLGEEGHGTHQNHNSPEDDQEPRNENSVYPETYNIMICGSDGIYQYM
jgi:hypothetical protein